MRDSKQADVSFFQLSFRPSLSQRFTFSPVLSFDENGLCDAGNPNSFTPSLLSQDNMLRHNDFNAILPDMTRSDSASRGHEALLKLIILYPI